MLWPVNVLYYSIALLVVSDAELSFLLDFAVQNAVFFQEFWIPTLHMHLQDM